MTNQNWIMTFNSPEWQVKEFSVSLTSEQMLELTRLPEFYELIEGSWVEGALVATGELQQ